MPHSPTHGHPGRPSPKSVLHRFERFPVLSSDTLVLRRLTLEDVPQVGEISYYDGVAATSDAAARAILERIERDYERGETVHWGIVPRSVGEVAGTCGFYRGYPENVGEVGYVLRERYRGRGIMTAALGLVTRFGFEAMGLDAIAAYVNPANLDSAAVLHRTGFRPVPWKANERKFVLHPTDAVRGSGGPVRPNG